MEKRIEIFGAAALRRAREACAERLTQDEQINLAHSLLCLLVS
jgi:hypothetical protein